MPRGRGEPARGEVYSIDADPVAGKEITGRHYWLILTDQAINETGMAVAVVVSTVAAGPREIGLTAPVSAGRVTGVAVLNQIRSLDLRARNALNPRSFAGTADAATMRDVIDRVVSLFDPAPPLPSQAAKAEGDALGPIGTALSAARAKKEGGKRESD